jgi:hypothetical protein
MKLPIMQFLAASTKYNYADETLPLKNLRIVFIRFLVRNLSERPTILAEVLRISAVSAGNMKLIS